MHPPIPNQYMLMQQIHTEGIGCKMSDYLSSLAFPRLHILKQHKQSD